MRILIPQKESLILEELNHNPYSDPETNYFGYDSRRKRHFVFLTCSAIDPIHAIKACLPSLVFSNRASYRR